MTSDGDGQNTESINVASVVSVDGADTSTAVSAASAGLLAQADRRRAAEKLRDKGWSYRRISENLNVPYILVSKWLSEDPLAELPPRRPAEEPQTPPAPQASPTIRDMDDAADTIETLKLQYGALEGYVQPMLAALEAAKAGLDTNIAEAAKEREQVRAKVAALETTVARLQMDVEQLRAELASGMATATANAAASVDPFAAGEEPVASSDPFADDAEPAADPFADDAEPAADPFAEDAVTDAATPAYDPFAEDDPAPVADPFAEEPAEPFADPFAEDEPATKAAEEPPPEVEPAAKAGIGRLKFWKR